MADEPTASNSLDIWCRAAGMTHADLGAAIGVDAVSAGRYRRAGQAGGRYPRPDVLGRIFAATGGQVDANALAGLPSLADFAERLVAAGLPFRRVADVFSDIARGPK